MFEWEEYSSGLYVEREQDARQLLDWANTSVPKQVKSLVAPPGAGKTWFLQAVQEKLEWRAKPDAPPERLVIFCQVPRLVNRDSNSGVQLNANAIFDWLEEIQKDATLLCKSVRPIDRSGVEIAALIARLVNDLCDRCTLQHPVIVLVDGLDEVTPHQAAKVEWEILQPFIDRRCIRMIIAHRDEYVLKNPLKNQSERFFLGNPPSADEQFRKFKDKFFPDATHLTSANFDQFKSSLKHYQWNHPYINAFLFDKALQRTTSNVTQLLTPADLRKCLFAVIERRDKNNQPRFGELKEETFDCLKRITTHEWPDARTWTLTDLETKLGLKEQDECIQSLFTCGIAFYNPAVRRYQLADGIRELARDLEQGG